MIVPGARRGHPLLFLFALLSGWLGLRVALWEQPLDLGGSIERIGAAGRARLAGVLPGTPAEQANLASPAPAIPAPDGEPASRAGAAAADRPQVAPALDGLMPAPLAPLLSRLVPDAPAPSRDQAGQATQSEERQPGTFEGARHAVGHALLTMMGLSQMQLPPALAALVERAGRGRANAALAAQEPRGDAAREPVAPARIASTNATPVPSRWSADGWLLLRDDSSRAPTAATQPSYGRSQAGAVIRYRLAPSSANAPQAYVRASSALRSPREAEIATGLSARPLARVPVRVAAEVRVIDAQAGTDVRPAAYAVTEFPPLDLPLGARAEVYAQAGYVGGDFATAFVDGQARVTRDVVRLGDDGAALSAGAGAWGGAQKGVSRLDIGPSAAVSFRLAEGVFARAAVDYRVRIAGDAEPRSGPALTLSAGF